MSKRAGMFVDNTFEPPDPRHDGRIPSVEEVDDIFHISWGDEDEIEMPRYLGRYEVIAITKKHVIAKKIGSVYSEEFDKRLIKQRNFVFVPSESRSDPTPLFKSPKNNVMLPVIARRVAELNIDLNAGEAKPYECSNTVYIG